MRYSLFGYFMFLSCFLGSCQTEHAYTISLKSNYKGWVYLLKSTDSLKTEIFYPDSFGIAYIPEEIYDSKYHFVVNVDNAVPEEQASQFYIAEFDDEAGRRTDYCKFYFPFTNRMMDEKVYKFDGKKLLGFQYLYYSHKIDENRLAR